ncbi:MULTISPECIES: phosphate ABC transporter substrate-binding protein [Pseudoalteromonas]|uniref:Phosphate ABC transporter substrate-binding protein n=1 Tax=Pseudoalteromonas amylolytica TaxID=1859457 RepID=A0A1S1MQV7_9GAMM|nr:MULTISPECIES: phosphate ABC transporter substrate-binding protein [Pseudoalteromonas]MCF6436168.1 phosphate ABC transporter substrate-binding protein [Pseudoalteromonas sp. MMG022]OHU86934.1 phosphate ABC transporter substrate-binding protein [Pseudoalteromonas sp. JW3]OHU88356.1 phosphate ABC transporter substrate-binding protein [Pseudoalteromonas amylolytica]
MLLSTKSMTWKVVLAVSTLSLFSLSKASAEVSIIVHPSNTSTFDQETIKKIFLGKTKSFTNGRSAILISASASDPASDEFNTKVIGKSSSQVKAYWSKILFTGKGTPPQEMDSSKDVISAVSSNPDAIGYVDASATTDSVKVVATF